MKKYVFGIIFLIISFSLVGCVINNEEASEEMFEVSFDSNGGTLILDQIVSDGDLCDQPDDPVKNEYIFGGWYIDPFYNERFDFSSAIEDDITLFAKWEREPLHIGVILPDASEERWVREAEYFEEELDALGDEYKYDILFSEGNEYKEFANAEALIARGVEVIILTAEGSGSYVSELCEEEGVTLIAHDRMAKSQTTTADYFTTFNSWDVGKAQGAHLVYMAEENGCSETNPCDLAIFSGRTSDWPNATYFFGGAMEEIQPNLDMFNIINVDPTPFESLGFYTQATFFEDVTTAKADLQAAMAVVDTDWNPATAGIIAAAVVATLMGDHSSQDVYVLAPNDDTSAAIRIEFAKLGDNAYANYYTTGQDASSVAIASLMGDVIRGHGTQTMTVYKNTHKLVADSVKIAKNVIDGIAGLTGLYTGPKIDGVDTVYSQIDTLLASDPQKTYDLIFATGYKDQYDFIFENIDFTPYEEE